MGLQRGGGFMVMGNSVYFWTCPLEFWSVLILCFTWDGESSLHDIGSLERDTAALARSFSSAERVEEGPILPPLDRATFLRRYDRDSMSENGPITYKVSTALQRLEQNKASPYATSDSQDYYRKWTQLYDLDNSADTFEVHLFVESSTTKVANVALPLFYCH